MIHSSHPPSSSLSRGVDDVNNHDVTGSFRKKSPERTVAQQNGVKDIFRATKVPPTTFSSHNNNNNNNDSNNNGSNNFGNNDLIKENCKNGAIASASPNKSVIQRKLSDIRQETRRINLRIRLGRHRKKEEVRQVEAPPEAEMMQRRTCSTASESTCDSSRPLSTLVIPPKDQREKSFPRLHSSSGIIDEKLQKQINQAWSHDCKEEDRIKILKNLQQLASKDKCKNPTERRSMRRIISELKSEKYTSPKSTKRIISFKEMEESENSDNHTVKTANTNPDNMEGKNNKSRGSKKIRVLNNTIPTVDVHDDDNDNDNDDRNNENKKYHINKKKKRLSNDPVELEGGGDTITDVIPENKEKCSSYSNNEGSSSPVARFINHVKEEQSRVLARTAVARDEIERLSCENHETVKDILIDTDKDSSVSYSVSSTDTFLNVERIREQRSKALLRNIAVRKELQHLSYQINLMKLSCLARSEASSRTDNEEKSHLVNDINDKDLLGDSGAIVKTEKSVTDTVDASIQTDRNNCTEAAVQTEQMTYTATAVQTDIKEYIEASGQTPAKESKTLAIQTDTQENKTIAIQTTPIEIYSVATQTTRIDVRDAEVQSDSAEKPANVDVVAVAIQTDEVEWDRPDENKNEVRNVGDRAGGQHLTRSLSVQTDASEQSQKELKDATVQTDSVDNLESQVIFKAESTTSNTGKTGNLKTKLNDCLIQIEALREEKEKVVCDLEERKKIEGTLRVKHLKLSQELETAKKNLIYLQSEKQELADTLKNERLNVLKQKQLETRQKELEEKLTISTQMIEKLEEERTFLEQELKASIERAASLQSIVTTREEKYSQMLNDQDELLQKTMKERDELEIEIKQLKAANTQDASNSSSYPEEDQVKEEKHLETKYRECFERADLLQSTVTDQLTDIKRLKDDLAEVTDKLLESNGVIASLEDEKHLLTLEYIQTCNELERVQETLSTVPENSSEHEKLIQRLKSEIDRLKKERAETQVESNCASLETQQSPPADETNMEKLRQEMDKTKEALSKIQKENNELNREREEKESEMVHLVARLHSQEKESKDKITKLEKLNKSLSDELADLKSENTQQLRTFIGKLQAQSVELEKRVKERDQNQKMVEHLTKQNDRLHAEILSFQGTNPEVTN